MGLGELVGCVLFSSTDDSIRKSLGEKNQVDLVEQLLLIYWRLTLQFEQNPSKR
jgi:hypothetical protein